MSDAEAAYVLQNLSAWAGPFTLPRAWLQFAKEECTVHGDKTAAVVLEHYLYVLGLLTERR